MNTELIITIVGTTVAVAATVLTGVWFIIQRAMNAGKDDSKNYKNKQRQ